jgi:serine/threonine-protein kinase
VLPFLNLTDDPGFEYFSDGLSEELIGLVGRIPGLRVIARTSSFAFKGTNAGLERIGKTLRTNLVLEGSVRRRADAIRVTARLNEASTGHQVWARQYDGRLEDVFAVQDEIAGEIADTLRQSIRDAALPQTARRTENLDARLLLLQAWYHWNKNSPESLLKAVGLFEQAAAADPANALAHAGLAFAWTVLSVFGAVPPATALERADEAAKQAIRYGPERAEAWGAAGCVEGVLKWNWSEGERGFLRALELNPNHVTSRHGYALGLLVALGRMEEAIGHMNRVLDLDPLSALVNCDFGATYTYAGRFDDALRQYRATLDLEPHNNRGQMEMGWLLLHMGRVQEGLQLIEQALDRTVAIPAFLGIYALGLALAGRRRESLSALDGIRHTNPEGEFRSNMAPFALDALGLREEALTEFERAYERRDPHLRFLNVDPRAHLLRGEPRFQALVRKMGLDRPIGKTPARNR